jgi:hypothetical protein
MARTWKPASGSKPHCPQKIPSGQSVDSSNTTSATSKAGNLDVAALKEVSAKNWQDFCKSKCTREAYQGHITRGTEFLASCVTERKEKGMDMKSDGINTDVLEKAFKNPPNEHSVDALELFLSQKCFKEGCGYSTAEAIHAAFVDHWDNM